MLFCSRCGYGVEEGADFCPACGKVVLAAEPEESAHAGAGPATADAHTGKAIEIIGFALFMAGVIWGFGATAASPALPNYTGPIVVVVAGIAVWAFGRFGKRRRKA